MTEDEINAIKLLGRYYDYLMPLRFEDLKRPYNLSNKDLKWLYKKYGNNPAEVVNDILFSISNLDSEVIKEIESKFFRENYSLKNYILIRFASQFIDVSDIHFYSDLGTWDIFYIISRIKEEYNKDDFISDLYNYLRPFIDDAMTMSEMNKALLLEVLSSIYFELENLYQYDSRLENDEVSYEIGCDDKLKHYNRINNKSYNNKGVARTR